MFTEGQILYFTPFYFKNGDNPKAKFFIVLKNENDVSVVASLPTKVDNAPSLIDGKYGCIDIPDRQFNCYIFAANEIICDSGFFFELPTHVYGDQIDQYSIQSLTFNNTIVEGKHYVLKGQLTEPDLKKLKDCILHSKSIKKRIIKMLS